jgi:hypothetical protein
VVADRDVPSSRPARPAGRCPACRAREPLRRLRSPQDVYLHREDSLITISQKFCAYASCLRRPPSPSTYCLRKTPRTCPPRIRPASTPPKPRPRGSFSPTYGQARIHRLLAPLPGVVTRRPRCRHAGYDHRSGLTAQPTGHVESAGCSAAAFCYRASISMTSAAGRSVADRKPWPAHRLIRSVSPFLAAPARRARVALLISG